MDSEVGIIRGEDKTWTTFLVKKSGAGPFDLTGNTALSACFKDVNGATITVTPTVVGSVLLGKLSITLTDTQTESLKLGVQSYDIIVDYGTTRRRAVAQDKLNVTDHVCD